MPSVIAVILGGGRGKRLRPLTDERAKPAVPIAGKYRLVDIPISNCLHGGIEQIYVLTQYQSASLNRHIAQTYRFDSFSQGYVYVLAAELTDQGHAAYDWYQGTADAVRKHLHRLAARDTDDVMILSGDQVYTMDLAEFVEHHRAHDADVTIAATRVSREEARRFGVMKVDEEGWIGAFAEKPKEEAVLDEFEVPDPAAGLTHLASMGMYIFKAGVLRQVLREDARDDFGHHIVPSCLGRHRLISYAYSGYWEDVGTIESYHRVNLHLTEPVPRFSLFDEKRPLFTRPRFLPPAKIGAVHTERALICDGAVIGDGSSLREVVLGIRSIVRPGCTLEYVVGNGAGSYDFRGESDPSGIPLGVGEGSVLRNCIVDRDARIGRHVRLVNERAVENYEDAHIMVRDGIIVVPRQGVVPDGYAF